MPYEWTQDPPERDHAYRYWWPTTTPAPDTPGQFLWQTPHPPVIPLPFVGDWATAAACGLLRSISSDPPLEGGWPNNYNFKFPDPAKKSWLPGQPLPPAVQRTILHLTGKTYGAPQIIAGPRRARGAGAD